MTVGGAELNVAAGLSRLGLGARWVSRLPDGPLGRMKLNRTTKPRVLGKKIIGSKRIGSDTTVEYLYSDTEKSHQFGAYRWNEDEQTWVEMAKDRDTMIF